MDCLTIDDRARLDALRLVDSFVEQTLRQVDRILASLQFRRVQQRARAFLQYVVCKTLLTQADRIKETTIAMAVFGESSDFDPLESSKVRVAATDLRQRLREYYSGDGKYDPIKIFIPLQTYVPQIRDRRVTVVVGRLDNWHPSKADDHFCVAIRDEIVRLLNRAACVKARAIDAFVPAGPERPRFAVRGSVESMPATLKINVSLSDRGSGRIMSSESVDGRRDDLLQNCRHIADRLLKGLTTST